MFFLATNAMDSAVASALDLHQKRQANVMGLAKLNAQADEALAWSAARIAGEKARTERLVRKGNESRQAAEDRCTAAHSRVR